MKVNIKKVIISAVLVMGVQSLIHAQVSKEEEILEFYTVDKKAEYPGGENAMMKFIVEGLQYPELAMDCNAQGTVLIKFVVEKDGSLSNVRAMRNTCTDKKKKKCQGACDELESEAVRIIKSMPDWKPAQMREKNVRMNFVLPIKYQLE